MASATTKRDLPPDVSRLLHRDRRLLVAIDDDHAVIRHLRGDLARAPSRGHDALRATALRFLRRHSDLFGGVDIARLTTSLDVRDRSGGRVLVLQQHHGSCTVHGGELRVHLSRTGVLDGIVNWLAPDLARVPARPRIDAARAVAIAREAVHSQSGAPAPPELVVYRIDGVSHLAWFIRLEDNRLGSHGWPSSWVVYVDARSRRVLRWYDDAQTAGPTVSKGTGFYSGPTLALETWFTDVVFQLRDSTRNATGGLSLIRFGGRFRYAA